MVRTAVAQQNFEQAPTGLEVRRLWQVPYGPWSAADRVLALTFDDGPFPDRTPKVLDVLAEHGVPATFFMIGRRVDADPGLARQVARAGHLVGSHGYTHKDLATLDEARIGYQVDSALASLRHHTGQPVRFFRPPFTSRDARVHAALATAGQVFAHWSVSVNDNKRDTDSIAAMVTQRLHPGAIVLLHEGPQTVAALPRIITDAHARGFRFVTLDGSVPGDPAAPDPLPGRIRRIAGAPTQHTAGLVASLYPTAARVIVTGHPVDPEVAAAVALAGATATPLLPAGRSGLASSLLVQLERLRPAELLVAGGEADLDTQLRRQAGGLATGLRTHRPDGSGAYAAAAAVALSVPASTEVHITTVRSPSVLLAVAATAGRRRAPLLPVPAGPLGGGFQETLRALAPTRIVLVGEASNELLDVLTGTGAHLLRVPAGDAQETSLRLLAAFPTAGGIWLVPSTTPRYAAIAAAARSAAEQAAMVHAEHDTAEITALLRAHAGGPVTVVGHDREYPGGLAATLSAVGEQR